MQIIGTNNNVNNIYKNPANIDSGFPDVTLEQALITVNDNIDEIGDQIDTLNSQMIIVDNNLDDLSNELDARSAIYKVQVHLTTANLLAIGGTPFTVLAAPGANLKYSFNTGDARINSSGNTAFTGGAQLQLRLGTTTCANIGAVGFITQAADSMLAGFGPSNNTQAIASASLVNQPLMLGTNGNVNFATGTGNADFWLTYSIVSVV